jgi:hypothetical protein
MHRAEAGSGKGDEDSGVFGNRLVDSLAAFEAGTNEMAGVAPVHGGTRRALQL